MKSNMDREYWLADSPVWISAGALKTQDEDTQIEVMHSWFLQHYEPPEENTPYDSGEGGYIYVWGGPYDPEELLAAEFSDIVPVDAIAKLAAELTLVSADWAGKPGRGDLLDWFIQEITDIKFYDNFRKASTDITRLIEAQVEPSVRVCLNRLLYANVIMALESFLSDAFITTVLKESGSMRKMIETTPEFKKEKISFSEIYSQMEGLEGKVREYLGETNWHNLYKVKEMYKDTLEIDFPQDYKDIIPAILVRHDIVHRNGKKKDGSEHQLSIDEVTKLLDLVESFALHVNTALGAHKIKLEERAKKQNYS